MQNTKSRIQTKALNVQLFISSMIHAALGGREQFSCHGNVVLRTALLEALFRES